MRSSSIIFLSFAFLISIICSAILPVLGLQYNVGILSYGTINYSKTNPSPPPLSGLHVDGTHLKDANGNIVILRGVEYGSNQWYDGEGQLNENQFVYMHDMGCTAVGVHISCADLENGRAMNDPNFWSRLDNIINWAETHGLIVWLRGFSLWWSNTQVNPHYVNQYFTDGPTPIPPASWTWNQWIDVWRTYARRYVNKQNIIFSLMVEPLGVADAFYANKMQQCIDAIRAIDPDRIIGVDSVGLDWQYVSFAFEQSYPLTGENIIFSHDIYGFHMYPDNSIAGISSYLVNKKADWLIANGHCVIFPEFNGVKYVDDWDETFGSWEQTWCQNFMSFADSNGYSGYFAFDWSSSNGNPASAWHIIADWSGTLTYFGNFLKTYYLAH